MNKNDESLISHALKLYELQYNDNIELKYYWKSYSQFIQVGDMLCVYKGMINMPYDAICNTLPNFTSLNLNININSFINHWMQYFNFNRTINRVAIRNCPHNMFDIIILCDDDCWYYVLSSPHPWVDDWTIYKW